MEQIEIVRVGNEELLQQTFAIRVKVFVEEQKVPPESEIDEPDFPADHFVHFAALVGGVPAGTVRMAEFDAHTAKLQRLAVLLEYRKHHLGSALVHAVEREAKRAGYSAVLLDGQTQARPFYEKLGYTAVSEEILYDAGIEHVRMKKEL